MHGDQFACADRRPDVLEFSLAETTFHVLDGVGVRRAASPSLFAVARRDGLLDRVADVRSFHSYVLRSGGAELWSGMREDSGTRSQADVKNGPHAL
jgi:hypothetical protein